MRVSPVLVSGVPGRKRIYSDVAELEALVATRKWLEGLKEGPHRRTALYNLARFLRWRKGKSLEARSAERLI